LEEAIVPPTPPRDQRRPILRQASIRPCGRGPCHPHASARLFLLLLAAGLVLVPCDPAKAQVRTWGGGTSTNWNTATNWGGNNVPNTAAESAVINGAGTFQPLIGAGDSFDISTTTVSGGALTVNGSLDSELSISGTGTVTIGATGALIGAPGISAGTLNHNGTIVGSLNVAGGSANLAGAITGSTTVSGGTLNVNAGSDLSDTGDLTLNGGTVNVNADDTVAALAGCCGTLNFTAGNGLTISQVSNTTFAGQLTGVTLSNETYLVKSGTGSLTLSGQNFTTGVGRVALQGGALLLQGGNAIANINVLETTSGTVSLLANETVGALLGQATGTTQLNANTLSLAGVSFPATASTLGTITGTGGLTVNAPGLLQRFDTALTYSGATTITDGIFQLGAGNIIANASPVVLNGGTLSLQGFSDTVNTVSLQSGSITGTGTLTSISPFDVRSGDVSAVLAGLVALNKTTAGTVRLTAENTYLGSTTVSAGTLAVTGTGRISSTTNVVNGGTLLADANAVPGSANLFVSNGGRLGVAGAITIGSLAQSSGLLNANAVSARIDISGGYAQSGGSTGGTLDINAATFSQSGGATIAAGTTVSSSGAQTFQGGTIAGVLDGPGAVTISGGTTVVTGRVDAVTIGVVGAGVLRAGGAALSGSADLAVSNGTWELTAPTMLQSLQVGPGGSVDFGAFAGGYRPLMVASYAGGGGIALNAFLEGSGSPSDQLIVTTGSVSGTTNVRVRNTGGLGASTIGDGILLIEINGASPADAFVLAAPGFVTAGDHRYTLAKLGNNWYLQSQLVALFQDGFE
jgi:autotransporter-associated beta strand protein